MQSLTVQGPPLSNRMLALTARMYDICRHSFVRVVGTVLLSAARYQAPVLPTVKKVTVPA